MAIGGCELGVGYLSGGVFLLVGELEAQCFEFGDAIGRVFGEIGEGGSGEFVALMQADDHVAVAENGPGIRLVELFGLEAKPPIPVDGFIEIVRVNAELAKIAKESVSKQDEG